MTEVKEVLHHNYADDNGKVYCKKFHKLTDNCDSCGSCDYCAGSLQGRGVECYWTDYSEFSIVSVNNPILEMLRVSKLIDEGKIQKG